MFESHFKNNEKIGIIAKDAGPSNLILAWILEHNNHSYHFCLAGPALKIFKGKIFNFSNKKLPEIINKCNVLIVGTSFDYELEHQARRIAKRENILNIAVFDHWVNYENRFLYNGQIIHPHMIWVFDKYAEKKASNIFKNIRIQLQPNFYVKSIVKKIKKLELQKTKNNGNNILYVLEPIRKKNSASVRNHEFKVLNYFLKNLHKLNLDKINIRLRPHPSDSQNKYDSVVKEQNIKEEIYISKNCSLEEDIAWADIVVGYETFALVVADECSKRCITTILPNENDCELMIKNIEYFRDLN